MVFMMNPMCVVDFPDQFRNDIFYCQRALREHIKIHQFCAIQQTLKPRRHYAKTIQIIEREMQAIGRDQRKVILLMKEYLKNSIQMQSAMQQQQGDVVSNQIIRAYLDQHRASITGLILQPSGLVKSRASEKDMIKRFHLLQDLQQFMRPCNDKKPRALANQKATASSAEPPTQPPPAVNVNQSRQKLMAALQFAKIQPKAPIIKLEESDDEYLQDIDLMPSPFTIDRPPTLLMATGEFSSLPGPPNNKRGRGRPRKLGKFQSAGSSSAPNTRPGSPEVTMPWVELPPEPVQTNEYDMPGFLEIFGLYTKEAFERLKSKRPERRRRNVQSTEKTDFHYGQLDSAIKDRIPYGLGGGIRKKAKPIQQYLSPKVFKKRRTFEHSSSSSSPTDLLQIP